MYVVVNNDIATKVVSCLEIDKPTGAAAYPDDAQDIPGMRCALFLSL